MSTDTLWSQANHTLTIIGHQKPDRGNINTLHSGYLAALVEAIVTDNHLPSLPEFRKFLRIERPKTLLVDYNLSWDEMFDKCEFRGHTGSMQASFPLGEGSGLREFDFRLFDFDRNVSIQDTHAKIVAEDKSQPWSSAGIEHFFMWTANQLVFERIPIQVYAPGTIAWSDSLMGVFRRSKDERLMTVSRWKNPPGASDPTIPSEAKLLAIRPHK